MNDSSGSIILYGSYGYTGSLIARECLSKNLRVILAGRNAEALRKQSAETGYLSEVVEIDNHGGLVDLLSKGSLVIHCGGPFQFTAKAMAEACLEAKTHYTDITGEHGVFELLSSYNNRAVQAGITVIPGTGFDVVPSDCLALHLKNRLPSATHLQLAFTMSKGGASRGTAKTMVEGSGEGSMIRQEGRLVHVPLGEKIMEVDFGEFKSQTLNIPWGDISTAWRSTGIPNIEVYMGATGKLIRFAKLSKYLNWLLRQRWVKDYLTTRIDRGASGPSEDKIVTGRCWLWGKVTDPSGKECISTLQTPSGYLLTAKTSVLIAQKILNRNVKIGYQTPALAYGADLILEVDGTIRRDV